MKNRRDFLKFFGIGAGAVASMALAAVAAKSGNAPPGPRPLQDVERGPKIYEGPDSVPGRDYIKERPKPITPPIVVPPLTPEQRQWIVDGEKTMTFDLTPPPVLQPIIYDFDIDYNTIDIQPDDLMGEYYTTTDGTANPNQNTYSTTDGLKA